MSGSVLTVAVAGYGLRGQCYSQCVQAHPASMRLVAVADLDREKVRAAQEKFGLPDGACFESAEALLEQPRLADVIFICTQDRQHVPMALSALEKGYHVLTEKPISPSLSECVALREAAHRAGRVAAVCHVLRYSPFYQKVKETIDSGLLGEVLHITAAEDVGYFHQAHSFVRGNWRNAMETSPMILAKSCHDMDLLQWLLGRQCVRLSSFGSLSHFRPDRAPKGSALRCLDGCQCKDACPYDAEKIYITNPGTGVRHNGGTWPCTALCLEPTEARLYEALKTGPYGRCVYHCDNDVVDHQVTALEFEGGVTADFTMTAFTKKPGRSLRVMGTLGVLGGDANEGVVQATPFGQETRTIRVSGVLPCQGHAGGDFDLVLETMERIRSGGESLTSIDASVHSHVMALAAEESRTHHGRTVEIAQFERGAAE